MPSLKLRDRDAISTSEGLIFRVFGYSHPPNGYICDAEYASAQVFKSENPKAPRGNEQTVFYKLYEDEGWKFIKSNFPQHTIFHEMLGKKVVGVEYDNIASVRKPQKELTKLVRKKQKDELLAALCSILDYIAPLSGLDIKNFGVFGSLLHGFYHRDFSDIDLIIYGKDNLTKLLETLQESYEDEGSLLTNEFEDAHAVSGKCWRFLNYAPKEFVWHQQRKLIYAVFKDDKSGRSIKTEFEPVKGWKEIVNEYNPETKIVQKGWVRMRGHITGDADAPFIPSIYLIEPTKILAGPKEACEVERIFSYMEEFRMQARKNETVYVEGNLEEVITQKRSFYQIALTYCPRYYEQVLKVA